MKYACERCNKILTKKETLNFYFYTIYVNCIYEKSEEAKLCEECNQKLKELMENKK